MLHSKVEKKRVCLSGKSRKTILICTFTMIILTFYISNMLTNIAYVRVQSVRFIAERFYPTQKPLLSDGLAPDEKEGFSDDLNMTVLTWAELNRKHRQVIKGGRNQPDNPSNKVIIIVPYRDRRVHLKLFLDHMHPFLQRQNLEYVIYVVEMGQEDLFNRASVSNAGFLEVLKRENTPCVIFHDIDMLPTNDENLYYCNDTVRHYAVALQQYNYTLYYPEYMGGIVAFPPNLFRKINGYSNLYEGWGSEDDDLYKRVVRVKLPWTRQSPELGRYATFNHKRQPTLLNSDDFLTWTSLRIRIDGLNSVNYTVVVIEERPLFTWILIKIKRDGILTRIKPEH